MLSPSDVIDFSSGVVFKLVNSFSVFLIRQVNSDVLNSFLSILISLHHACEIKIRIIAVSRIDAWYYQLRNLNRAYLSAHGTKDSKCNEAQPF